MGGWITPVFAASSAGVVTHVVDGDTVWVSTKSPETRVKVRILGIDAPEICQPGGKAARDALHHHVLGQRVTLSAAAAHPHDDYGRKLARLERQGEDVGAWMVLGGYAWSYGGKRQAPSYAAEQAQARAARRGLFAQDDPEPPYVFRQRHGSCYR